MSTPKGLFFLLIALSVFCIGSVTAKADTVTFTLGNNPQPNEENVLLNNSTSEIRFSA
jgi:hypothetical protein